LWIDSHIQIWTILSMPTEQGAGEQMTSEAKHTPAPWQWVGNNLEGPEYTDVIDASVSCGRFCLGGSARMTMSDADRALIAAAPDLLSIARRWAALDGGAWHVERLAGETAELLADTRTAIAKATP
jgi:hypothetical protein